MKLIRCRHKWLYGKFEGSNARVCEVCGKKQEFISKDGRAGYINIPRSRIALFNKIYEVIRLKKTDSLEEIIRKREKVTIADLESHDSLLNKKWLKRCFASAILTLVLREVIGYVLSKFSYIL